MNTIYFSTFSIVAHDRAENSWGVAVASKFLAVGAYVPAAQASAGAIATQAFANLAYASEGLELLKRGRSAADVIKTLTEADDGRAERQLGVVDAQGQAATYSGDKCMPWAGGLSGEGYAIQGNILAGERVVRAMESTYLDVRGELADRLYAALRAGDEAGGDRRGKQAAALLVVKPNGGYGGGNDRYLDLRVDDHANPLPELGRLLTLHHLFFGRTPHESKLRIDATLAQELQALIKRLGYYQGEINGEWDEATRTAAADFIGVENLEERVDVANGWIDPPALAYIRERFGAPTQAHSI